jgi:hypothetical protein
VVRSKPDSQQIVLHVLNCNYDKDKKQMNPLAQVKISFEEPSMPNVRGQARILSYDAPEQRIDVQRRNGLTEITLPELKLWKLVIVD